MPLAVYTGRRMAAYGFKRGSAPGGRHYFGADRFDAFDREFRRRGLDRGALLLDSGPATDDELELFHTRAFVEYVRQRCASDEGALDHGPTPAERGMDSAAAHVVGAVLDACRRLVSGEVRRAFVPISGFHHARADRAAGYCIFNDCAVALAYLRVKAALPRVAYIDIDVHLGDGVLEGFRSDPGTAIIDIHQDERTFWYAPADAVEIGPIESPNVLSIPMQPGAGDGELRDAFTRAEALLEAFCPELIVLQCGADGLAGDALGGLSYTEDAHRYITERAIVLAEKHAGGRLLALGGGGYHLENLAAAWSAVVEVLSRD
jgi:acetoin utilization protein AcuC